MPTTDSNHPALAGHYQPPLNEPAIARAQSLLDRHWPLAATSTRESVRAARELFAMSETEFARLVDDALGARVLVDGCNTERDGVPPISYDRRTQLLIAEARVV